MCPIHSPEDAAIGKTNTQRWADTDFRGTMGSLTSAIACSLLLSWTAPSGVTSTFLLLWLPLLLSLFSISLIFPRPYSLALFTIGIAADLFLNFANDYKIARNSMPITAMDVDITINNPNVLWQVLAVPIWLGWTVVLVCLIALTIFTWKLLRSLRRRRNSVMVAMVATLFITAMNGIAYISKCEEIMTFLAAKIRPWQAEHVAELSKVTRFIPFVIYSRKLAREGGARFFDVHSSMGEISPDSLRAVYERRFDRPDPTRPNIIVVQLESIFDPNLAFETDRKIRSSLFEQNTYTKLLAPMRVNIIGGGSWVSEFEAVTGLDSRLFGYLGYYTHISIAPKVESGLPTFLTQQGYHSSVYYTAPGVFYNSRNAYRRYGFDKFFDSNDLGLAKDWITQDVDLVETFIKKSQSFDYSRPFFSYIVTNGAHSPYTCDHFTSSSSFQVRFKSSNDFEMNCQLNEYLRLLENSQRAVEMLLERLKLIEAQTGRPFILVAYGDHQPHAFTRTSDFVSKDYDDVRTTAPKNQTFMHVMSSTKTMLRGFEGELPITLIPTLISGFIADDAAHSYLSSNVYLFEKCGPDLFQGLKSVGKIGEGTATREQTGIQFIPEWQENSRISEACKVAQDQTIATQRKLGIVSTKSK